MCTGAEAAAAASIIGAATAAAGTGVSIDAAREARDRMEQQLRGQLAKQTDFQRQATPLFQASLAESTPTAAREQIGRGESEAAQLYRQLQAVPGSSAASPLAENALVNARTQQQIGQQNRAQAALQGYRNFSLQQWLKDQQARENLGIVSNLSQSSAALTPYLLQGAQNSTQNLAAVGSLLGTAGSLAGVYGSLYPYLQNQQGTPQGKT